MNERARVRLLCAMLGVVVVACGPSGSIDLLPGPPPPPPSPACPEPMPAGPKGMPACSDTMTCPMMLHCNAEAGVCMGCMANSDCMPGQACDPTGRCLPMDCVDGGGS